jgi:hypothetical protein
MIFSNQEVVKKLRMVLLIIGACSLLTMAVLVVLGMFTAMVILAAIFLIAVLTITMLNFQYIRIAEEKNKLIVRYYSIFSFERNFETFEFPVSQLWRVKVTKHFLGLKWDIRFTIRVKKGLADYPPISLSAFPFRERSELVRELRSLVLS